MLTIAVDARLELQIPSSARVVRTPWINTKQRFSLFGIYPALLALPDAWIGWLPWAVAAGRRVLRHDRPDVIYSTSPHATAHLVALELARISRLPWVADFRDPWVEDVPEPGAPSGTVYRKLNSLLERRVVERCSHIVTSTARLRDRLLARYARLPERKFTSISNGYDEADFSSNVMDSDADSERFLVVHAGSINADFRDPQPLLRALHRLIEHGKVKRDKLNLRFIGPGEFAESDAMRSTLATTGLDRQVTFVPRAPYDEALREVGRADLLLLLQASADTVDLVPAKLYEYLRAQKPVLALVHPGATSEVLAVTGGGWAVDPRDQVALSDALLTAYEAWLDGTLRNHAAMIDRLRLYDRKVLTSHLAALFDELGRRYGAD